VKTSPKITSAVEPKCTIAQAAEYANVSTKTVRRWITQGLIEAERMGPRLIRVNVASLDRLGTPLEYTEGGSQ
jgi:excisionase family DNA binding protein